MGSVISKKYLSLKAELNERQRRLWAASEALSFGYGGISTVARATGLSRITITRGIKDIEPLLQNLWVKNIRKCDQVL